MRAIVSQKLKELKTVMGRSRQPVRLQAGGAS